MENILANPVEGKVVYQFIPLFSTVFFSYSQNGGEPPWEFLNHRPRVFVLRMSQLQESKFFAKPPWRHHAGNHRRHFFCEGIPIGKQKCWL